MGLAEKDIIVNEFSTITNQDERYKYIIKKGRSAPELAEENKVEKFRITGCVSMLWLFPELKEGKVYFQVDSDAAIPKGIAAILAEVYSGITPDEALAINPTFLSEVGIDQHLSMNRRNGLSHLIKQIQLYASAFKALAQAGQ